MRFAGLFTSLCLTFVLGSSALALAAAPTITGISPNNGTEAGGTAVTITGTGFIAGSTVKFGSNSATGVTVESSTVMKGTSPAGTGLLGISVTNTNGTSSATAFDQFGYDPMPSPLWLGLNGNSGGRWLGSTGDFTAHNIAYDRGGGPHGASGEEKETGIDWEAGELPKSGDPLEISINAGMIPVITIEYKGYDRAGYQSKSDPEFPQTRSKKEEEEGKNTIKGYAEGFAKSASAILKFVNEKTPGRAVLFEPMNEPWNFTTPQYNGKEYANVVVEVLHEAATIGIPPSDIYIGAIGYDCTATECGQYCTEEPPKPLCISDDWVPAMYAAQPKLETEIKGWYFHPYGPPAGAEAGDSRGIESVPAVQAKMTSGQNNIVVSEVGYCDKEAHGGEECGSGGITNAEAEKDMTEMLTHAKPYHEAGWLKALIIYSRNANGWEMELEHSVLTKEGEAFAAFGDRYGLGWSSQSPPSPSGGKKSYLEGVSCTSSTACIAVGNYENSSGATVTLAEQWSGTEWKIQTTPNPSGAKASRLSGISCTSSTACIAVGNYESSSGAIIILAEQWNGTEWKIQSIPSPTEGTTSVLDGVSCTSTTNCVAVGWYLPSRFSEYTLAENWNGTEWKIQATSHSGFTPRLFRSVSCTSVTGCTAAGEVPLNGSKTLGERWGGSEWAIQETRNVAAGEEAVNLFTSVSCVSSMHCVAVGDDGTRTASVTLAEQWNGTEWTTQSTPNPLGAASTTLGGISCVSTTACVAVGSSTNGIGTKIGIATQWNGTEWLLQPIAIPIGAKLSKLAGVSCASPTMCVAVGDYENSSGATVPLASIY